MGFPYTSSDFKRDLVIGDTGEDVKKLHEVLKFFGFQVDEKEINEGRYGESTQEAAEKWRKQMNEYLQSENPIIAGLAKLILQVVFQISPEDIEPDGTVFEHGTNVPVRQYREATTPTEVSGLEVGTWGRAGTTSRAVNLASQFIGQREQGNNGGPMVRKFCEMEGVPWCAGFVHYAMKEVSPQLFNQTDFLSALSYEREAAHCGAFRGPHGYVPKSGDPVVFGRKGGGHIGIVRDVTADGTVTYIAGNDGDAVRERTFNINHPPASLHGYADVHEMARFKGISIAPDVPANSNIIASATKHSDKAFKLG